MKQLTIKCDKCQEECKQPNGYASFIYMVLTTESNRILQKVVEEHYCPAHTDKIREFIKDLQ